MKCKHCRADLLENSVFCTSCGKRVSDPEVKPAQQDKIPESPSKQPQSQDSRRESSTYSVPPGYSLDERNGLYYISDIRKNAATGQLEQHVTYFNIVTGEYMKAVHPIDAPQASPLAPSIQPSQQQAPAPQFNQPPPQTVQGQGYQQSYHPQQMPPRKGPKVWLIILIIVLGLLLVVAASVAVVYSIKSVDTQNTESSIEERSESIGSWEMERQRLKDEEKKHEEDEAKRLKEEEEAKKIGPITTNKSKQKSWYNFPQNSFYYAKATQNEKYNYVLYKDDADIRYQFLYRQLRAGGKLELVLDVGEEFSLYGLSAVDNYLFYTVIPVDSGGYLDYDRANLYYVDDTNGKQNLVYTGESGSMAMDGGFVYFIQETSRILVKVGINKKGEIGYEEIDIVNDNLLYPENISVLDGKLYINTFDYYTTKEIFYTIDLENGNSVKMYEGQEGVVHDYTFVDDMDVYYINYNSAEDSSTIEKGTMGDYTAPEVLLSQSWEGSEYITDFLARVGNKMYFSKGQGMYQAPIGKLDKGELLFEMETYAYSLTSDAIFMPEKIYHIDSKVVEEVVKPTGSALVKFDKADFDDYVSKSTYNDSEYNPDNYKGDVYFSDTGENLFETIGYGVQAMDFERYAGIIPTNLGMDMCSRYFLESKVLRDLVVGSDGKVDMDTFKIFMYEVFLNDYDVFEEALLAEEIPGFLNVGGEIYLDKDWEPEKTVESIDTNVELEDDSVAKITVTYTDGTTKEAFVYFYEVPTVISEYTVYYISNTVV